MTTKTLRSNKTGLYFIKGSGFIANRMDATDLEPQQVAYVRAIYSGEMTAMDSLNTNRPADINCRSSVDGKAVYEALVDGEIIYVTPLCAEEKARQMAVNIASKWNFRHGFDLPKQADRLPAGTGTVALYHN